MRRIFLLALLQLPLAVGCSDKPAVPNDSPPTDPATAISASELIDAFTKDSRAASDKFLKKKLDVTGVVSKVGFDIYGRGSAMLVDALGNTNIQVRCELYIVASDGKVFGSKEAMTRLAKGKKATIRGKFNGTHGTDIVLSDCSIVQVDPGPPPLRTELEGRWEVVSMTRAGKPETKRKFERWSFEDDILRMDYEQETADFIAQTMVMKPAWDRWDLRLEPKSSPKKIKLIDRDDTREGIYELDGDNLKVRCGYFPSGSTAARPTDINDAVRGDWLVILKRAKAKE